MTSVKLLITGLILAVLAACTPMIYGVPQERWDIMSEQERIVAMETYTQRQIAHQQAAAVVDFLDGHFSDVLGGLTYLIRQFAA